MAIATVNCTCRKCGAEFTIRAKRTNRAAANDYVEWAAENIDLCPDCYRTEQREQRRAENAEKSEVFTLPELDGSPKQIAWANDLRLRFCADARRVCGDNELMLRGVQLVIDSRRSARWWIDNRYDVDYANTLINRILRSSDPEDVALTQEIQALTAQQDETPEEENEPEKEDITMRTTIIYRHGSSIFSAAVRLNVDDQSIISNWESRIGEQDELAAMLGKGPITQDEAADAAYWEIVKACTAAYFGGISRADAVVIANAITDCGSLCLADDLCFSNDSFASAWNAAHPDDEPIQRTPDFCI